MVENSGFYCSKNMYLIGIVKNYLQAVRADRNQPKPSLLWSALPGLIETNVQRPPLPLSCVRESGAMSMCQNDRGSASSAQTIAARITEA
jgi:hypothetical protein